MSLILKIAFLNVLRNKRRTLITVLAIMFGCVSIIIYGGYVEATYVGVRDQTIYSGMGHLQVFKKGYNAFGNTDPEKYMLPPEAVQKIMEVSKKIPEIKLISRRISFGGLLNNGSISNGIFGEGIEAEQEERLKSAKKETKTIDILYGEKLSSDQTGAIMLGKALADTFNVKAGDSLTLISATVEGAVNALDVTVGAVVTTGDTEKDSRFIQATLNDIQILKNTQKISQLTILLHNTADTFAVQEKLEQEFKKAGFDFEMKNWDELAEFYHQIYEYYEDTFLVISMVILFVVIIGIANTMTMAVMERTSELGTLRALGNNRKQLVALVLSESIYIGIIGAVFGIFLGVLLAEGITTIKLMQPPPPGCTRGYPYEIFYTTALLAKAFMIGIASSFISSIYPSIKASRLKIVDALRHE